MNDDRILDILNKYIKNPKMQYAILIDGDWGSGKTYFIKNKFVNGNKNIIYIPLNGIKNREDIDKKIYYKILESNMPNKVKESKGIRLAKKTGNAIFSITNELIKKVFSIDISGIRNIDSSGIIGLFKNISDYVIVFDDLERCDMPINEVLGYINDYVEHRNVKCIIVANEKEINKINYDENYELKVLSCLNGDIDYGDKQESPAYLNTNNKDNKKIDIPKIKKRILNMYEGNKKYKAIKEKLIGITIKYTPNIVKVYDQLIIEYENQNEELYKFLKENKDKCIDILKLNNCNNIRTLIFIIDRFDGLYREINVNKIDKKNVIIDLVFKNVIFSSIGIKKGINIRGILSGAMCSNAVTLTKDSRQNQNNYYTAFNFVDDYIIDGNIDKDKMLESIKYYLNSNYEKLEQDDPYNKIKIYWELDDEEIKSNLLGILDNLKKNKYNYQLFPKIIYSISCIENLKLEINTIKDIIDEIGKYIEENKIEYMDFHVFARDEKVLKIYNKNIGIIKEKIKTRKQSEKEKNIKEIFKSNNWGVELLEYVRKHENDYLDRRQFLNEFCISEIVGKIAESNSKNIYYFKYCIDSIYNFSNLKEYYSADLKSLEELIEGIDNIDKEGIGITKKEAIEYLSKILKEIRKILE